jgi:hypothetical protein
MHLFRAVFLAFYVGLSAASDPVYFLGDKIPTHKPQTDAQAAYANPVFKLSLNPLRISLLTKFFSAGQAQGRLAESVELLQPLLDSNLTDYVPVSTNLTGNFTFAASDVLAVLSKNWVSAFMKMYVLISYSAFRCLIQRFWIFLLSLLL